MTTLSAEPRTSISTERHAPAVCVLGCGAISRRLYLPALARHPGVLERTVLVDPQRDRADELAEEYGVAAVADRHDGVLGDADAVIVAAPHHLHRELTLQALDEGCHVLCEKPLAPTPEEARLMTSAAQRRGLVLAVNNTRRFHPANAAVADVLESGRIGRLERLTVEEGSAFGWPTASGFYFRGDRSARGVLLDLGAHVVDLLCWWTGERPRVTSYRDDSLGGPEAQADLRLAFPGGAEGRVRLSYLGPLPNRYRIEGSRGVVEGETTDWQRTTVRDAGGAEEVVRARPVLHTQEEVGNRVVDDFLSAVRGGASPLVTGAAVVPSIEVIDEAYERRQRMEMPWLSFGSPAVGDLPGDEIVLVTGATGFIGGRLTEVLTLEGGPRVRAGVRSWSSAARIGRLPVEMVPCDVLEPDQLARAMEGVDAVVHCAYGTGEVNTDGTWNVLEAARTAGVRRVVHLSTVDVYDSTRGTLPETAILAPGRSEYGDTKIEAEDICRAFVDRGVDVVILRPTLVYGPFSQEWTIRYARLMATGRWKLPREFGEGACNLVYVDDAVEAILRALVAPGVSGEAFNVNGPETPTWREYLDALNRAGRFPPMPRTSMAAYRLASSVGAPVRAVARFALDHLSPVVKAAYRRSRFARRAMERTETAIRTTGTMSELDYCARSAVYPVDKAEELLGYAPRVSMREGIDRSVAWLDHHGYLEPSPDG